MEPKLPVVLRAVFNQGRIQGGGRLGRSPPLKPAKVTFFTMILYNSERYLTVKYY